MSLIFTSPVSPYRDYQRLSCVIHRRSRLPCAATVLRNAHILHGLPAARPV